MLAGFPQDARLTMLELPHLQAVKLQPVACNPKMIVLSFFCAVLSRPSTSIPHAEYLPNTVTATSQKATEKVVVPGYLSACYSSYDAFVDGSSEVAGGRYQSV